jgi:hypothetical protein
MHRKAAIRAPDRERELAHVDVFYSFGPMAPAPDFNI